MLARFFVPGSYGSGDRVELPGDEARHLTRVLRLRAGDEVRVFDGRGREFHAAVAAVSRNAATVHVQQPCASAPEPRVSIVVAHAVLKGDRMDDVVRDAVMMGAAAIQPVVSARTEVALAALTRGNRRDRWGRVAISSAKQCGRSVVPSVLEPLVFGDLVAALATLALPQPALMLVEPAAADGAVSLAEIEPQPPREATVVIGPEGGWDAEEIAQGATACRLVTLGRRTLRADAMSTVALAALFAVWREF